MANKWNGLKQKMSPESRGRVEARVQETLRTMPLAEIRKAIGLTQADLAGRLEVSQGSVSKFENAADMYLTTLRKYVEALGGQLHLTARFADGRELEIDQLSGVAAR
ncbi:MAG: helix-turn-helix transcriptional regulator [Planctomycetota bacterium]|nr:helix-turn-helix transcriptional regulator [Planctomycetota bacterium]